jgi:hypothetical protein
MLRTALPTAFLLLASPALAQDPHAGHGAAQPPAQVEPAPQPETEAGRAAMDHMRHEGHMPSDDASQHEMTGGLGAYPMSRDASGTAWQPDASQHGGLHAMAGEWLLMGHAMFNTVFDWQEGPRGDEKTFLAGMVMAAARRDFTSGTLNLRAMLSPDPAMGANGYPLLFAAGETANGADTLIDRQHPHDLFMELSASYAHRLSADNSVFVYAGLPGEPAFGPPTFMHRMSAMDSPEAPISHHWFDSTHITFGVLTAGYVHEDWKLEASRFRGREPDEHRYDIETGDLDSTAARLSWNPTENWSLQASWADIASPEALDPDQDETRWSVSGLYTAEVMNGWWSATLAYATKESSEGAARDAWLAEAALHPNQAWTLFARAEAIETNELAGAHGPVEAVQRLSLGAIRDWRINESTLIGIGALAQQHFASDALEPNYGGDPQGAMAFLRLKVG